MVQRMGSGHRSSVRSESIGDTSPSTLDSYNLTPEYRQEEATKWNASPSCSRLGDGDRLLLWHGSRSTNFAGILKQGLRIAPPEGEVSRDWCAIRTVDVDI